LRLVGGLTTTEIAAGLLLQEATLAQRIVRAKRKIRDAGIPLTIPTDLTERVDVVLGVLYLIFNEGYLSRATDAVVRIDLVDEAVRLTEALATVVDDQPEVLGLLALERFHRARAATRSDASGDLILLEDQDRTRWDLAEITAAGEVLMRALRQMQPGPYQLQAVIARYHATARTAADTDWPAIVAAYAQLVAMTGSPVARLNHAVAVAMADGHHAGLAALDRIDGLNRYHLFHAARGELLTRAGRTADAADAFATALSLTTNDAERRHLTRRRDAARS
jgi:RNA polymerase sigma-70 factor, ECF subfamily